MASIMQNENIGIEQIILHNDRYNIMRIFDGYIGMAYTQFYTLEEFIKCNPEKETMLQHLR
jgi:hypothetical protein